VLSPFLLSKRVFEHVLFAPSPDIDRSCCFRALSARTLACLRSLIALLELFLGSVTWELECSYGA